MLSREAMFFFEQAVLLALAAVAHDFGCAAAVAAAVAALVAVSAAAVFKLWLGRRAVRSSMTLDARPTRAADAQTGPDSFPARCLQIAGGARPDGLVVPGVGSSEGGEAGGGRQRRARPRGGRRHDARREAVRARLRALLRRAVVKLFVVRFRAAFEPEWARYLEARTRWGARQLAATPLAGARWRHEARAWGEVFWWAPSLEDYRAGVVCRPPSHVAVSDYTAAYREYLRGKYESSLVNDAREADLLLAGRLRALERNRSRARAWDARTAGMTPPELAAFQVECSERFERRRAARYAAEQERERQCELFYGGDAVGALGCDSLGMAPLEEFDFSGELTRELDPWECGSSAEGSVVGGGAGGPGGEEDWGSEGCSEAEFDGGDGAGW